jgi:hypothetical protein
MASNFEKEPIFLLERKWDDTTKLPEKYKFQGRNAKAEVCINSGTLGMEFFLEKTLDQFNQAGTRLNLSWEETFSKFENVLGDSYRTTWNEVLNDRFPKPLKEVSTHPRSKKEDFDLAIELFIKKSLIIKSSGTYNTSIWPPEAITALHRIYLPRLASTCIVLKRCFESPSSFLPAISRNHRTDTPSSGIICPTTKTIARSLF